MDMNEKSKKGLARDNTPRVSAYIHEIKNITEGRALSSKEIFKGRVQLDDKQQLKVTTNLQGYFRISANYNLAMLLKYNVLVAVEVARDKDKYTWNNLEITDELIQQLRADSKKQLKESDQRKKKKLLEEKSVATNKNVMPAKLTAVHEHFSKEIEVIEDDETMLDVLKDVRTLLRELVAANIEV